MGFSSDQSSGGGAAPAGGTEGHASFGDKLGSFFQSKYPIAGGLADMVFGNQQQQPGVTYNTPPIAPPPGGDQMDTSLIGANSQPHHSGLGAIIKLLMG